MKCLKLFLLTTCLLGASFVVNAATSMSGIRSDTIKLFCNDGNVQRRDISGFEVRADNTVVGSLRGQAFQYSARKLFNADFGITTYDSFGSVIMVQISNYLKKDVSGKHYYDGKIITQYETIKVQCTRLEE